MTTNDKPPQGAEPAGPFTIEYWKKQVAAGRLMFVECQACGHKTVIPAPRCNACGSHEQAWREAQGAGTIYTYTITFVPPPQLASIAPYVAAVVELAEGVRLNGVIQGADPTTLPEDLIGKPVEKAFLDVDGVPTVAFRLA